MEVALRDKSGVRTMKRALALLEEAEGQPDSGGAVDNLVPSPADIGTSIRNRLGLRASDNRDVAEHDRIQV